MFSRSYRLDTLHHKFLKPKGISIEKLEEFASALWNAGFIGYVPGKGASTNPTERYEETEKMTSRKHQDELFKIVGGFQ